jgi:putative ABC transport system permease protein
VKRILLLNARRDLRASLAQTIALVVIVALGVAGLTALVGAYRDLGTSYNRTYDELNFADATFAIDSAPEIALEQVGATEGVAAATGRLVIDTGLELPDTGDNTQDRIRLRIIGIPADTRPAVNDVLVLEGDYLDPADPGSLLVEFHFADYYESSPGDTVTPLINGEAIDFNVAGVAASPEYLVLSSGRDDAIPSPRTFAVMFIGRDELQQLSGAGDTVNDIAVTFEPGADGDAVIAALQEQLEPYGIKETIPRESQPSFAALKLDLEGYRELAYTMPTIILLVAAASLYIMLSRQVRSQQGQIGLMKALGYGKRAIVLRYLMQAIAIGIIGSAVGLMIGLPLAGSITSVYAKVLGIPLVDTSLYADLIVSAVAISIIVAIVAGIGPALTSARMQPAAAMRQDPTASMVQGKLSLLERAIRLPFWLRLPLRNLFRARRRTLTTGIGVIFAFILILMTWGLFDSMRFMIDNNFNEVERWDAAAYFDRPQQPGDLESISHIQGVEQTVPLIQLPGTISNNGESRDLFLTALPPDQDLHHLELNEDITPAEALAGDGLVLHQRIAEALALETGDAVTLETYLGSLDLTVSATVEELFPGAGYASLEKVSGSLGMPGAYNGVYLEVDPSLEREVSAELYRIPDVNNVQLKTEMREDWQELLGLFYAFMGVMLAFALVMAFALLFNSMTVNVLERRREFATMRSVGAGRSRIAMLVSMESLFLWLVTLVPGLFLGWLAAKQLGAAFDSDLFVFRIIVTPMGFAITALGILATMLLAALPAIRRINRLNLAEATKILN